MQQVTRPAGAPAFFSLALAASVLFLAACASEYGSGSAGAAADSVNGGGDKAGTAESDFYQVECGHVDDDGDAFCYTDRDTYVGWRTYHGFCHVCHAQDAVGSTFAPNLLDRMREIDKELFIERVHEGYTGQVGVMPPWKDNPNVSKRYDELYAYLMARADGALPPGRPKRFPKE